MLRPDDKKRISQIKKLVGPKRRILDIGCAEGEIMQSLKDIHNEVVGIDIQEESVKLCKERGLEVYLCDIEKDNLPVTNSFDAIIMTEVLEHLIDPLLVLRDKVFPLLKEGGLLIVSVPNSAYFKHRLNLLFGRISDFGDDQSKIQPKRPYNLFHKTLFSKSSIVQTLEMAGFKVQKIEPTTGVVSNKILKLPIFDVFRKLFPSFWAGGLTILAIRN